MTTLRSVAIAITVLTFVASSAGAFAAPIVFTQEFPGGFNVSINNGPLAPSGPLKIVGVVETSTADIDTDGFRGEFPLTSVTLNGAGFVNRPVGTPLSLLVFSTSNFAFQRIGEFNEGITGWNGATSAGVFIANVNNLSTLLSLPYITTGSSTFWWDGLNDNRWTLAGGDTIGGSIGGGGPNGTFSIGFIPEPASVFLAIAAMGLLSNYRHRALR